MPKIRSVHPGQWVDDRYVTTTIPARLLSIAVRNFADDNGIFEWNPLKLKMQIFPADTFSIGEMGDMLNELAESGQVLQYESDGKPYGIIRNFRLFQSPQKPSFLYPVPEENTLTPGYELHKRFSGKGNGRLRDKVDTGTGEVKDQSHTGTIPVQEGDKTIPLGVGVGEGSGTGVGVGEGEGDPITSSSSSITQGEEEIEKPAAAAACDDEGQKLKAKDYAAYFIARGLKKTAVEKPNCMAMFKTWAEAGIHTDEVASVINPIVKREKGNVSSPMYFKPAMDEYLANRKTTDLTKPNSRATSPTTPTCSCDGCKRDAGNPAFTIDGKPHCIVCFNSLNKQAAGEN